MSWWNDLKIRNRITISIIAISFSLTVLLVMVSIATVRKMGSSSLREKGSSLSIITAETVKAAVQYNVSEDVEKVLNQIVSSDADVSGAAVVIQNAKDELVAINQKTAKGYGSISLAQPLKDLASFAPAQKGSAVALGGGSLQFLAARIDLTANDAIKNGYLLLALNSTRISHEISDTTTIMAGLGLLMMMLGTACAFLISRTITNPLIDAVAVANTLAEGDLRVDVVVKTHDEIGQLMTAMKTMDATLREVLSESKSAADNLASISQELSDSSQQMSRGVAEQANKVSQIATSSAEMSQTVADIARNASDMANATGETRKIAHAGEGIVNRSVEEVKAISTTVKEASQLMESLGDRSKQIGEIVSVIKDIADQTNLLALNAAIEAARAGEQGRGFAVVADEVRKLAERTARATAEIGGMITAIQVEVEKAVSSMSEGTKRVSVGVKFSIEAGEALSTIVSSVNSLQSGVQQIASATEEMSTVSDQINGDIETVATVSKETANSAELLTQSASGLAQLSRKLAGIVGKFKT